MTITFFFIQTCNCVAYMHISSSLVLHIYYVQSNEKNNTRRSTLSYLTLCIPFLEGSLRASL